MKNRLKPMGVGTILDNSFSILRERFWTFQGVNFFAFLPMLGIIIISLVVVVTTLAPYFGQMHSGFNASFLTETLSKLGSSVVLLGLLFIALFFAMIIGSIYFAYGNMKIFKCGLHQEPCTIKQAFEGIKGKRWRAIGLYFTIFLITLPFSIVGSILIKSSLLLYFIVLLLEYIVLFLICLSWVVIFIESNGVFKTISRAFSIMAGHRWRVLGTLFLVYLLGYVLMFALIALVATFIAIAMLVPIIKFILVVLFGLIGLLVMSTCISYFFGPLTSIYYDLLIRKEGYDIQQQLNNSESVNLSNRGFEA